MTDAYDYGRHEFKYVLPLAAREQVLAVVGAHVIPDPHAAPRGDGLVGYANHSIYLDTPALLDYHQRLDERRLRNRLRVRTYGQPGDGAPVFLENKRKVERWVVKQRVRVPEVDADGWARWEHDRPWREAAALVRGRGRYAADHFLRLTEGGGARPRRVPVSAVHYFREVYVDPRGGDHARVRLTMDREVCATVRPDGRALYAAPDVELLPADWMVIELKYSRTRPGWMRTLCRELGLRAIPVPKFGLSVARGLRADAPREAGRLLPRPIRQMGWGA